MTAVVLWIGMGHVRTGELTLGSLLLVMSYLGQLYSPLKTIGRKAASLQGHLVGAERAFSVLDQERDVPERPNALSLKRASGSITFQNVLSRMTKVIQFCTTSLSTFELEHAS